MPTLKDTHPLYLNNKAAQPNTDLAVTDKFTGEVAFRTALASPEIIDEAIAGAVRAAEPMAKPLPVAAVVLPRLSRASVRSRTIGSSPAICALPPALSAIGP